MAVTTRALLESVPRYGPATTGTYANTQELWLTGATILNRVVGRIVGTNITMRADRLMFLADIQSTRNHYVRKSANILDRTLGHRGTAADRTAASAMLSRTGGESPRICLQMEVSRAAIFWDVRESGRGAWRRSGSPVEDINEDKESAIWEISASGLFAIKRIKEQKSQFCVKEESINATEGR